MINYLTAAQWTDNLYVLVGIVVFGTILAVGALKFFFKDYSDSI